MTASNQATQPNNQMITIQPTTVPSVPGNPNLYAASSSMSISEMERMGAYIAGSKMFGIQTTEQAVALMFLCQSEGLHPMQAVRRFHLINGKASMRSDAMLAEFQDKGGTVRWEERSNTAVTGVFSHPKGGEITTTWTLEDAKRAGLLNNPTWSKYPRQMLVARVISEAIRTILPGVVSGIYTPEEVEDFEQKPQPRHQSPQGSPSFPPRTVVPEGGLKNGENAKALSAPIEPVPGSNDRERMEAARAAFSAAGETRGHVFVDAKDRGAWANICLGRPADSRAPITIDDWNKATEQLPTEIDNYRAEEASDNATEPETADSEPATPATVEAASEPLTDPFSDEDPFQDSLIPDAHPEKVKKNSRDTGTPKGMI